MNRKELKNLMASLRYLQEKCEELLIADEVSRDPPIDDLAVFIAHLFEQGGNDRPLREWFREVEKQTVQKLVKNGANNADFDRYMGMQRVLWRQHFHRRYKFTITDCWKKE